MADDPRVGKITATTLDRAPVTGVPLRADEVPGPTAGDIATEVVRRMVVPRGPVRCVFAGPFRLDQAGGPYVILGGPGKMRGLFIGCGSVSVNISSRANSLITLCDRNNDVIAATSCDFLAAAASTSLGNQVLFAASQMDVMFANGIQAYITVPNGGYSAAAYWWVTLYYESIPIGQKIQ
jgi:hypothetical protein